MKSCIKNIISLVLVVFLLAFTKVYAQIEKLPEEIQLEVKILEKISIDISKKDKVNVFVLGYNPKYLRKYSKVFKIVQDCSIADIIIAKENDDNILAQCPRNVPGIALNYALLKEDEIFIGALFWYKGRPNLVFIKSRLEKFRINLPKSYSKFIEERIW